MKGLIYDALAADSLFSDVIANDRIKFYKYPEAKSMTETHIIIDPLDTPKPGDYADDQWLTDDFLLQIDVWSKDLDERDLLASRIQQILWDQLNLRQVGGMDEYDQDYDIFRDARRYRGKAYRKDFNKL